MDTSSTSWVSESDTGVVPSSFDSSIINASDESSHLPSKAMRSKLSLLCKEERFPVEARCFVARSPFVGERRGQKVGYGVYGMYTRTPARPRVEPQLVWVLGVSVGAPRGPSYLGHRRGSVVSIPFPTTPPTCFPPIHKLAFIIGVDYSVHNGRCRKVEAVVKYVSCQESRVVLTIITSKWGLREVLLLTGKKPVH